MKILKIFGGLFVAIIIIGMVAGKNDNTVSSGQSVATTAAGSSSVPRPPSTQELMQMMMPADQAAIVRAVEIARQQYASAPNDMAKGASRPGRALAICAALRNRSVDGWIGRVAKLDTNGDGKGVLHVEIGPKVSAVTWNNSFSDISDKTLIEPTSPLFAVASQLRIGQLVRFDGTLFQDDTDCVQESSMSLSGSIREPNFTFRFQSISTVQ